MRLFSIGKYSLPLVFAFLIPLFGALNNYISKYLRTHSSIHYFVDTSCWIYNLFLSGIFEMISRIRQKREIERLSRATFHIKDTPIYKLNKDNGLIETEYKNLKKFIFIFVIAILDFVYLNIMLLTLYPPNIREVFSSCLQIILFLVFSMIILKYEATKKNLMGLAICLIGILFQQHDRIIIEEYSLRTLFFFIGIQAHPLSEILKKYVMTKLYVSPFFLLFTIGLIQGVFQIGYLIWIYMTFENNGNIVISKYKFDNFDLFFYELSQNKKLIFVHILNILVYFFISLFQILTNYYLTPTVLFLSNYLSLIVTWTIGKINSPSFSKNDIYVLIASICEIVGSLVYNEIIIFHFWGLDKDTKKEILKREEKEDQEDIDFIKGLKKNGKANKLIPTPSSDEEEK